MFDIFIISEEILVQPAVRDEHDAAIQLAVRNQSGAGIQPAVHDVVEQTVMTSSPPQAKKTRTVPSTSIANVLTSSPYKKMVTDKISEKEKKQKHKEANKKSPKAAAAPTVAGLSGVAVRKRKPEKKRKRAKRKSKVDEWDDEDDEQWPCIVCCEAFSRSREKWVAGQDCGKWAHEDCTPGGHYYTYHNCDSE